MLDFCKKSLAATLLAVVYLALGLSVYAQSGNSTSVTGVVADPSGAVIPNATVEIQNPVSGYVRSHGDRWRGKVYLPERSLQSLSPDGYRRRALRTTCTTLMSARQFP